ncbi:MAG: peptide deformylase [Candidatus Omnitrophica bacterium]|nr:peptide deformylase [Candidatus Omnitrophota bacterium]
MSQASVLKFPDFVLRRISKPVQHIGRSERHLIELLIKTMEHQPGGIGIAAPQIGVLRRIAIVDVSPKAADARRLILINPEIVKMEEETVNREGCMSLPDYTANVRRAARILVRWDNYDMKRCEYEAKGLEARCIQHEVDHLNGMLFVDRVASLKRDVFRRKRYL